jgi:hypothetical protein
MYSGMYEKKKEEGLRDLQVIDIPKAELRLSRHIAWFLEGEGWFGVLFHLFSSLPDQERMNRYHRKRTISATTSTISHNSDLAIARDSPASTLLSACPSLPIEPLSPPSYL